MLRGRQCVRWNVNFWWDRLAGHEWCQESGTMANLGRTLGDFFSSCSLCSLAPFIVGMDLGGGVGRGIDHFLAGWAG